MKGDVGKVDQVIRVFAGIFTLALGLVLGSWWGLIGLVLLITGMAGRCPLYALFGVSTGGWDASTA
ncbi:MAG TPA: DUF2892 domain-containing protein [Rhodothermales bacterium]|nr:DUF2892 domain-containing protein [Rhodothermales bacterium]